jgi:hypothetical protein
MTGRVQRETPSFPAGHLRHGAQLSSPYRAAHRVAAARDGRDAPGHYWFHRQLRSTLGADLLGWP